MLFFRASIRPKKNEKNSEKRGEKKGKKKKTQVGDRKPREGGREGTGDEEGKGRFVGDGGGAAVVKIEHMENTYYAGVHARHTTTVDW